MMFAADRIHESDLESLLICLLVTALVAVFVWAGCRFAGRPDIGGVAAAVVVVVGALLCLL